MINGDDLYDTYAQISRTRSPLVVWIFSKIYIYIFIGLFIYVVLSLFIGIIGDTYERLKVCMSIKNKINIFDGILNKRLASSMHLEACLHNGLCAGLRGGTSDQALWV